jgi:poly-gamma-glutamate capsule biosynthesis protein CapA/YwtB (metallophosphatase superfamily)
MEMVGEQKSSIELVAVGDVSPNRDDPPSIFRYCGDVFHKADIVFGQLEVPLSDRGTPPLFLDHPARRLPARNISALTEKGAGFDVMSFACNHAMDHGWEAFYDTLDSLKQNNIAMVGAGKNIEEARRPVILERKGTRVGFLGYLSIVDSGLIADEDRPGCVPLRSSHYLEQIFSFPGTPPRVITRLFPGDRQAMEEDIKRLRPQVDVLVVSMHCGVLAVRALIAMYQKEAAYAAIDAGADMVLQHHAHILKGIEVYKGKVIFYGLSDFAQEHGRPFPGQMRPWEGALSFRDPATGAYVFADSASQTREFRSDRLKTMVAMAYIDDKKIQKVTYIPTVRNANREPEVLTRKDPRSQEVFNYVSQISDSEDLNVHYSWDGDEVLIF